MVSHVAHSFASKTKFRNQKEAMISYRNEVIIKLRNVQKREFTDENSLSFQIYTWATSGLQTKVAHR